MINLTQLIERQKASKAASEKKHVLPRGSTDFIVPAQGLADYNTALTAAGQSSYIDTIDGTTHAYLDWKPHAGTIATFNTYGMEGIGLMVEFYDGVFYP